MNPYMISSTAIYIDIDRIVATNILHNTYPYHISASLTRLPNRVVAKYDFRIIFDLNY